MKTAKRLSLLLCAIFVAAQPVLAQNGEDTRNKAVMTTDDGEQLLNTDEISIIRFDGPKVTVVQPWGATVFDRTLRSLTFLRPLPGMLRLTVKTALNGDDAVTRGVDINGSGQLAASWKAGDQVYVYPDATTTTHIGTLTPETTSAKTSKLTGDVTATGLTSGQTLYLSTKPRNHSFATQTNSLDDLFYYKAEATVTITGGNASIANASFSMAQSVTRFTLQDGSSNAVNATQLVITGGTEEITVTSTPATNVFYVAMPAKASTVYSFTATTSDSREWTGTKTAALVDGKYYRATVTMTKTKLTVTDPSSTMTTPVTANKNGDDNQIYTGAPLPLVNAGESSAGTVYYKMTTANTQPAKNEEGWSTDVPTATAAGTYYVWYYAAGNDDYNATDVCTTPVTVTIDKATLSVTANDYSGIYDGAAHGITVTCEGATIKYRTASSGDYDLTTNPTYTDAAAARTVYYQVTKDNYTTVEGSKTVTIGQLEADLSWSNTSFTYDGSSHVPTATVSNLITGDACTVTVAGAQTAASSVPYTATATALSNSNYKLPSTVTQTFTIAPAASAVTTAPTGKTGLTYNGSAQELVDATSAACTGGTLVYSKTSDGEYGAASTITETSAGTYSFYYKVQGDANHTSTDPVEVTGVTIANATLSVTASDYSGTYDGAAHGITVTCEGATIKYRTAASGEYDLTTNPTYTDVTAGTTVYYQVTKDNYTTVEGSKTVTITAASMSSGVSATPYNAAYDGSAHGITVSLSGAAEGATVMYGTTEGTYNQSSSPTYTDYTSSAQTVYYQVTKANYETVTGSSTVTIDKAAATLSLNNTTAVSFTSSQNVNATNNSHTATFSGGTLSASSANTGNCTVSVNSSTGVITVTRASASAFSNTLITVSVSPDGNHTAPSSVTFNVSAAAYVESATMGSYNCAKVWTSATGGYYIICTDHVTSANWSTACNYSVSAGGKTFTCGTKPEWEAIMTACGGRGYQKINTKCSGVTGWSNMAGAYWSSTENDSNDAWRFGVTFWVSGSEDSPNRVRLVSAF